MNRGQVKLNQIVDAQAAIDLKQDKLVSGTNLKTLNGSSLLGSGDIQLAGGGGATNLDGLSDVTINNPLLGQGLTYSGGQFINDPLFYKKDVDKLKSMWKPIYGYSGVIQVSGNSWGTSFTISGNYPQNGAASYTKYGKWLMMDSSNVLTSAALNNSHYLYNNYGNSFRRCGGGFRSVIHEYFGVAIQGPTVTYGTTNSLCFIGVGVSSGNTLGTTVNDFSSLPNEAFGVGWRPTDTNLQIFYRNTSAVLNVIDLGSGFPIPNELAGVSNTAFYELILDDLGTTNNVRVTLNRLDTGTSVVNTIQPYLYAFNTTYYRQNFQLKTCDSTAKMMCLGPILGYQWIDV